MIPKGPKAKDTTVDLLVIGSGTGMATALSAKERGLSTLVVEHSERVGGSTARSGGAFWVPGNPILQREGSTDTKEEGRKYLENLLEEDVPRERWEAFIEHGPDAIAMLERNVSNKYFWAKGYSDYHPEVPGGTAMGRTCESDAWDKNQLGDEKDRLEPSPMAAPVPMPVTGADYKWMNLMKKTPLKSFPRIMKRAIQGTGGMVFGKNYIASGEALAGGMFHGLIMNGIEAWTRTDLVDLIIENDKVVGAILEQDGNQVTVRANKGVVLAMGGFEHDEEARQKHEGPEVTDESFGTKGNVGDNLRIAKKIGAGTRFLEEAWWFPSVERLPGMDMPQIMLAERNLPGSFIVDETGERFINEAMSYMAFGQTVLGLRRDGRKVEQMWIVMDQEYRNNYVFAGSVFPMMPFPKAWYDAGIVVDAKNPQELAQKMGVPVDAFVNEILHFNQMASTGIDADYGRGNSAYDRYYGDPTNQPNPCLRPLHGKLYAVKMVLGDLGTCGGFACDEKGRVLREDGSVIEGLYAQGNAAGNVFGHHYPGAGATISQGLVFGHIIAGDAAGKR